MKDQGAVAAVKLRIDRRDPEVFSEVFSLKFFRLAEKYRACARQGAIQEPALSRSLEMLSRINEIDDVRELMQLLYEP